MRNDEEGWLTAKDVQSRVRGGEVAAQEVVADQLRRIQRYDGRVHAYTYVDHEARAGQGPLAGVTIAVKDTEPVRGMPWTAGSPKFRDRTAEQDSLPVRNARERGAAILGKVNTPELAAAVCTTNPLFPATENPWRPGLSPGGSSGGSGAAVAAGLCSMAFGTDMGGSIRVPAACCGVLGLRPSPMRVPTDRPDPIRLSVLGPLARSALDLRIAFEFLIGEIAPDPQDRPLSIVAIDETSMRVGSGARAALDRAAAALEAAGHHVVRGRGWTPEVVARAYQTVRPVTLGAYPGDPSEYGPDVAGMIEEGRRTSGTDFLAALERGINGASFVHQRLHGHDLLLTPTLPSPPRPIDQAQSFLGDEWTEFTQFVLPVSFAGLPAISVPAGLDEGLPVGVQLVGAYRREWLLLDVALQLDRSPGFGFQRPPGYD